MYIYIVSCVDELGIYVNYNYLCNTNNHYRIYNWKDSFFKSTYYIIYVCVFVFVYV